MPVAAAVRIVDLPLGPDGNHIFPPELARRGDKR
jgi:hypothetical protein